MVFKKITITLLLHFSNPQYFEFNVYFETRQYHRRVNSYATLFLSYLSSRGFKETLIPIKIASYEASLILVQGGRVESGCFKVKADRAWHKEQMLGVSLVKLLLYDHG